MFELVLFWILGLGAVGTASMVVLPPVSRNPIYAAIALVFSFFFLAGLYMLLLAHLMAVLQILVYAGAIMVLFLFVIMLLNMSDEEHGEQSSSVAQLVGVVAMLFVTAKIGMILAYADEAPSGAKPADAAELAAAQIGTMEGVSDALYSAHLVPFELTGILLLIAVIGAVVLSKRTL